jgi:hypothetical protein
MINSFGAGGSYANLVVEEFAPEILVRHTIGTVSGEFIYIFSAKTEWSLSRYLGKMRDFLAGNPSIDAGGLAHSLLRTNHALKHRVAIIARSVEELAGKIDLLIEARASFPGDDIYLSRDTHPAEPPDISDIPENQEIQDLRLLARHWAAGRVDDFRLYADTKNDFIRLPKYAFDHNSRFPVNCGNGLFKAADGTDDMCQRLVDRVADGELTEEDFIQLIKH